MEARGPITILRSSTLPFVAVLSFTYFLSYPFGIGRADESHLLFEARRVLEGEVIYRDFFETLTPLSFYLFAGIFRIAGTSVVAARVSIALIEALGCVLLFHLVRRVAGRTEAVLVTMIFAGICIPTWPYASPHWISTTMGLLVAATVFAERWRDSMRLRPFAAGVLVGIAICVQQQRGVFLSLWLPLAFLTLQFSSGHSARWRQSIAAIAYSVAGATLVVFIVLGHAAWRASVETLVDLLFGFALANYEPAFSGRRVWAAVLPLTGEHRDATWIWLLRVAPLFVLGEATMLALSRWRGWGTRESERAALCLLAVLMGLSVWYLPDFIHVSFILPFLLVPGAILLHRLRTAAFWSHVPGAHFALTLGCVALLLAVAVKSVRNVMLSYAAAPLRIETAFGTLRVNEEMAQLFEASRRHLVPAASRSVVYSYPSDAWLYLALPADNPTPFSLLAPNMFPITYFEQAAHDVRERPAGLLIVLTPFLSDRGAPLGRLVEEEYRLVEELGLYRFYVHRSLEKR